MLPNSKRFSGGATDHKMQLDKRRSGPILPGRAKMSFRAPSISTVAKVVGRLKKKYDRNKSRDNKLSANKMSTMHRIAITIATHLC